MEFRIAKTEFLRGVRLAQGIADRKRTMPMLANRPLRTMRRRLVIDANRFLAGVVAATAAASGGEAITYCAVGVATHG